MTNQIADASMSAFTSKGEVFAHLNPKGVLKVWNTSNGKLLSEWKHPSRHDGVKYTRIACSFVGKKRRKERGTCLVAYATNEHDIYTISATDAEMKWKLSRTEFGEIAALSFTNKGRKLCAISTDGTLCEMNSETGDILKETKFSKKYISTLVYIFDDKILAASDGNIRVLSLEDGDVLVKFSSLVGPVLHLSNLEDTNVIITSGSSDNLSVHINEPGSKKVTDGPVLLMKDRPLTIDCKNGSNGDDIYVLSVSDLGIAYIWNMKTKSQVNITPTKIKVEANDNSGETKKKHNSIVAARLISINSDDQATILVVYGSLKSPRFASVDVTSPGKDIVVNSSGGIQENEVNDEKDQKESRGKKRAADADSENASLNQDNGHATIKLNDCPIDGIEGMGMKLFGDDGNSEGGDISKIEINEEFARKFEHNKKREELQRYEELKKKGLIEDSEEEDDQLPPDDDEEEEDMANYSVKQDLKFFDALIKVRNKDPSLKNNDAKLFDSEEEEEDDDDDDDDDGENDVGDEKKEKKKKPMFLKDVNAKHLLANGAEFDDEDDEEDYKNSKKSYFEEQEEVRKEFLDAIAKEEDDDGDLLKVKDDKNGDEGEDEDDREFEKKLDEYFKEDDKLDENEKFLKDFFRKKMWLEKDDGNSIGLHDVEIDVSEDEKELEKQEDYEREYNFRYEENAGDRVMGHSRTIENSVRKKENSRKIQRVSKKERMAQAEFERNEELKHLKNLKKKELNEKLKKIREIAGFGENGDCLLDERDLEEEFDPDEYDKKMNEAFNDKFYEANDVDPGFGSDEEEGDPEKPNFDKEDELLGLPKGWDEEYGLVDGLSTVRENVLKTKAKDGNEQQLQDGKKKRKRSKLEEELIKKKLDEIYKLECEDTIGDLRTRFKYKPVNKNTYGLKAKEILLVDEKELNQIVPLKKLATYKEDEFVVPRHKLKEHKQRIKSLIRGESSDGQNNGSKKVKHDVGQTETEKSKSVAENEDEKNLSKKQRRKMRLQEYKISDKRRMAYEGSTGKSNKKKKHKS